MSEPELAYMGGNDEFDLPRWQTQTQTASIGRDPHDYLSSSAQAAQHAAALQQQASTPYLSPYAPPQQHQQQQQRLNVNNINAHSASSPSSRHHRLPLIDAVDGSGGGQSQSTSLPYLSPTTHASLSRSASLGAATTLTSAARGRRQHHAMQDDIEGNPPQPQLSSYNPNPNSNPNNVNNNNTNHQHSHSRQHSTSFYPSSVAYQTSSSYADPSSQQQQQSQSATTADTSSPYSDVYFSTGQSGPAPKRSLTHHDTSSSSSSAAAARAARSPLRSGPGQQGQGQGQAQSGQSGQAFLDPYAASSQQQSQYSPTTATYPPYQSPPYGGGHSHSRGTSKSGGDILTPPLQSPYTPSLTAGPAQSSQAQAQQARYSPASYGLAMDTSSPHPPQSHSHTHTHTLTQSSIPIPPAMTTRQNSISQPNTPLQFPVPTHSPAYGGVQQDAMVIDPPQKRRASGFRRVRDQRDLRPSVNPRPGGRRVDSSGVGLSVRFFCLFVLRSLFVSRGQVDGDVVLMLDGGLCVAFYFWMFADMLLCSGGSSPVLRRVHPLNPSHLLTLPRPPPTHLPRHPPPHSPSAN